MNVELLVHKGSSKTRFFQMKGPEMIIGRHADCGLRIPAAAVSRHHCRLTFTDGILYAEDLDSANGIYLNGEKFHSAALKPGDLFMVGPITFLIQYPLTPEAVDRLIHAKPTRSKPPALPGKRGARALPPIEEGEEVFDAIPLDDGAAEVAPSDLELPTLALPPAQGQDDIPLRPLEPADLAALAEDEGDVPLPRKKKKKKGRKNQNDNPDYSGMMKGEERWQAPEGENLRDLLSKLEDED